MKKIIDDDDDDDDDYTLFNVKKCTYGFDITTYWYTPIAIASQFSITSRRTNFWITADWDRVNLVKLLNDLKPYNQIQLDLFL